MLDIRKIVTIRDVTYSELGHTPAKPIVRAVGMAVIDNPYAGKYSEDLRGLFEAGALLGERLMPELVKLLDGPAVSYGKGAIVGVQGEMEHGGACCHPMLGRPMRAAIGGGKAVIGSNVKVAPARHQPRHPARPQGRFLVVRAFRHDHRVDRRLAAAARDTGRDGDRRWRPDTQPLRRGADPLVETSSLPATIRPASRRYFFRRLASRPRSSGRAPTISPATSAVPIVP